MLHASICDTEGQCGSGQGDLDLFFPTNLLSGSPPDYFVFCSEYSNTDAGFEEWRYIAVATLCSRSCILDPARFSGLAGLALRQKKFDEGR